jgi:outer membrane immunogenic protein
MFRRTLLASVGAIALTGSAALAADLPSRAPPPVYLPPPPIFSWTGLYVGINAGGTWSSSNTVDTDTSDVFGNPGLGGGTASGIVSAALATASVPVSTSGFIGGGQIGYNYQFANSFVVGLEADIQGVAASNGTTSVFSQAPIPGFPGISDDQTLLSSRRLDYLGTVRGRLGFTITPTLLVYGTGGLAYGGVDASTSINQAFTNQTAVNPFSSFGSLSTSRVGWTAGGGLEWLFAPNWSVKAEYLYYDLGSASFSLSPLQSFNAAGTSFTIGAPVSSTRFRGNIVRAGLNYHFNLWGPAPVIAKY